MMQSKLHAKKIQENTDHTLTILNDYIAGLYQQNYKNNLIVFENKSFEEHELDKAAKGISFPILGEEEMKNYNNIRMRANGTYQGRITKNGITYSVTAKTAKECAAKLKKVKFDKKEKSKKSLVRDWFQLWFEKYKKPYLAENTIEIYNNVFQNYIFKSLGNINMKDLKPDTIQDFLNHINKTKERQATIVYRILKAGLQKAEDFGYIPKNPAKIVEFKTVNTIKPGKALTIQQQKILLDELKNHPKDFEMLIKSFISIGARLNEGLWLNTSDIDIENKTIIINGTKNHGAVRPVPINDELLSYFLTKNGYIFEKFRPRNTQDIFSNICKKLNLKNITIHSLRHTFATRCIESGIALSVVQKWLGHSTYKMTADTYSHVQGDFERSMAEKMPF